MRYQNPTRHYFKIIILMTFIFSVKFCDAAMNSDFGLNTRAQSVGNAVTAYPMGPLSVHYNPAGLMSVDGKEFTLGASYPVTRIEYNFADDPDQDFFVDGSDPMAGLSGNTESGAMYVPISGPISTLAKTNVGLAFHKPGSRWAFGVAMYMPYGMGFTNDSNDPTQYGAQMGYNQRWVYLGPAVSYEVSNSLSLGLSMGLGQGARGLKMGFRSPVHGPGDTQMLLSITNTIYNFLTQTILDPDISFEDFQSAFQQIVSALLSADQDAAFDKYCDIKMDSMTDSLTTSFNIGLLWEPSNWFSGGLCYRSESRGKLRGNYSISYSQEFQDLVASFDQPPASDLLQIPTTSVSRESGIVTHKWTWPRSFQVGMMLRPLKKLRLMYDLNWVNWSVIKREEFKFDQNIQLLRIGYYLGYFGKADTLSFERNWKDTWTHNFGFEYDVSETITARLGYEKRENFVRDEYFDLLWPVQDCDIYSCGVGFDLNNKTSIDLGFSYADSDKRKIPNDTSKVFNSLSYRDFISPYAGLEYEQETTAYLFSMNINYIW